MEGYEEAPKKLFAFPSPISRNTDRQHLAAGTLVPTVFSTPRALFQVRSSLPGRVGRTGICYDLPGILKYVL